MRIALLGPTEVHDDAGLMADVGGAKQRSVLAQLCRWPNRAVTVDRLAEGVWGELVPPRYRQNLQVYVSTLRRALEPGRARGTPSRIIGHADAYELVVAVEEVDVLAFDRLCDDGLAGVEQGRFEAAAEALRKGLQLWRGDPLGDLANQPFAASWADQLLARRLIALEGRLDADLGRGRGGELVTEIEQLVRRHPERERFWEQLAVALYRGGRHAEAAGVFRRARIQLRDEFGLEPGPALRRTAEQILRQDPQLLAAPADDVRTATLPAPLTRLIGRDTSVSELVEWIRASRLTCLVGPGGAGKSRLALGVAAALADQVQPVWVPLSGATSADQILPAVVDAFGVQVGPDRSIVDWLAHRSRTDPRPMLLLLDNLEQLTGAGRVVASLLEAVPLLKVLATSRSPLGVAGERVFPVGPLDVGAAMELFAERAVAVDPTFDLGRHRAGVMEVCRQLDGLALAVELAAARSAAFSPEDLAHVSLTDFEVDPGTRHGSLRALVLWSVDLLEPPARALFARLAICEGGFDTEVAIALGAATGLDEAKSRAVVATLVRASLVRAVETDAGRRFAMLSTVRAVALDLLGEQRRAAIFDLCALWIARARVVDPLAQPSRARLAAASVDLPLTRQVLAVLAEEERVQDAALIVVADRRVLAVLGRPAVTLADANMLLAHELPAALRARLQVVAGGAAYLCGVPGAANLLEAVRELDNDDVVYRVLGYNWLAVLNADKGDHAAAQSHADRAVAASLGAASLPLERLARSAAAWAASRRGDGEAAFEHSTRQVELAAGDVEIALGLTDLSAAELLRGRLAEAELLGREAVTAARRLGPSWTLSEAQRALAFAQLRRGDTAGALTLISSCLRMSAGASDEAGLIELVAAAGLATAALGRIAEGRFILTRAKAFANAVPDLQTAVPRELTGLAADLLLRDGDLPDLPPVGELSELIDVAAQDRTRDAPLSLPI